MTASRYRVDARAHVAYGLQWESSVAQHQRFSMYLVPFRIFHQSNGSHFRPLRFAMIRENHAYCLSTTDPVTDRRGRPRPCITKGCVTLVFRCDDDWERCFADLEVLAYDESVMEWVPTSNGQVPPARRPISAGCDDDGRALYYALGEMDGRSVVGVTAEHMVCILSHDPLELHTFRLNCLEQGGACVVLPEAFNIYARIESKRLEKNYQIL